MQWCGNNVTDLFAFMGLTGTRYYFSIGRGGSISLNMSVGVMIIDRGMWVVRHPSGTFSAVADDVFMSEYEAVL